MKRTAVILRVLCLSLIGAAAVHAITVPRAQELNDELRAEFAALRDLKTETLYHKYMWEESLKDFEKKLAPFPHLSHLSPDEANLSLELHNALTALLPLELEAKPLHRKLQAMKAFQQTMARNAPRAQSLTAQRTTKPESLPTIAHRIYQHVLSQKEAGIADLSLRRALEDYIDVSLRSPHSEELRSAEDVLSISIKETEKTLHNQLSESSQAPPSHESLTSLFSQYQSTLAESRREAKRQDELRALRVPIPPEMFSDIDEILSNRPPRLDVDPTEWTQAASAALASRIAAIDKRLAEVAAKRDEAQRLVRIADEKGYAIAANLPASIRQDKQIPQLIEKEGIRRRVYEQFDRRFQVTYQDLSSRISRFLAEKDRLSSAAR